jgi:hypothetical protein
MCVAATARTALARGFRVVLPHDGHATYDIPATAHNSRRPCPRLYWSKTRPHGLTCVLLRP